MKQHEISLIFDHLIGGYNVTPIEQEKQVKSLLNAQNLSVSEALQHVAELKDYESNELRINGYFDY